MKVTFHTNLDNYSIRYFPDNLTIPPRKGDKVFVCKSISPYLAGKHLPLKLEVVDVMWHEDGVICELWYCESDIKLAELNGIDLF